jgi:tetratricopeptide (TPR) repeat protein
VVAAFALLLGASRRWGSPLSQAFALLMAAWLLLPAYHPAPVLFGMFFLSLFLFLIERPMPAAVRWAGLLIGQVMWVNMHPSFVLGPLMLFFALLQRVLDARDRSGGHFMANTSLIKQLAALLLLTLLATMVNPYGLRLPFYLIRHAGALLLPHTAVFISPFSQQFNTGIFKRLVTFVLILGAGGLITLKKKLPVLVTALAVIGAFLLVRSLYYVALFVFMAFPFMVLSFDSIGQFLSQSLEPMLKNQASRLKPAMVLLFALCCAGSVWGLVTNAVLVQIGSAAGFGLGETGGHSPALKELIEHPRFPEKMLNLPFDGPKLAWQYPGRKVYCDIRPELFSSEFTGNLTRGLAGEKEEWKKLLNRWVPHAVLIDNTWSGSGMAVRHLTNDENRWKLAYFDGAFSVLLSPSSRNRLLLKELDAGPSGLQVLEDARRRYQQQSDGLVKPVNNPHLIGAAQVFNSLGRHKEAAGLYRLIVKNAPGMTDGWLGYGVALAAQGRYDDAATALQRAVRLAPRSGSARLALYRVHEAAGDDEAARRALDKAQKLFRPEPKPATEPEAARKLEPELPDF